MQKKLLFLSFIEGAAVMAAELCGAKLLAPIFGSSLYVWASVMGITLVALAAGYFSGGMLAEKTKNQALALFRILSLAALFMLLMPVLSYYLVPRISYLSFLTGVVMSTMALLFFPVFFLGAASPLFISIQTTATHSAGKVSGTVYAVSTAGGILATFVCGFYLIPQIGLNACLLFFGGILFVANFVVLKFFRVTQVFFLVLFVYLNYQFSFKKGNQLLVSDSILGHLEVQDVVSEQNDPVRILKINSIVQTEMNLRTKRSVSEYVKLLDTLIRLSASPGSALVLGLGGGLTANLLVEKNYSCDGVELDGRITEAASRFFYLDEKVHAIVGDARYFLNSCEKKYDAVLVDVFKAEEQPSHVLTLESLQNLKRNLNDDATLYINWHGYTSGSKGLGTAILYNTLVRSGFKVKLCSKSANENYRNIIFVASLHDLKKLPFELNENFEVTQLINSDNFPLLEKYNAEANKTWRANYLRYYQSR